MDFTETLYYNARKFDIEECGERGRIEGPA
jgi:hypothetical protein